MSFEGIRSSYATPMRPHLLPFEHRLRIELGGCLLRYYTSRVFIGTPPQKFALIVDTGSTVTYVPCSAALIVAITRILDSSPTIRAHIRRWGVDPQTAFLRFEQASVQVRADVRRDEFEQRSIGQGSWKMRSLFIMVAWTKVAVPWSWAPFLLPPDMVFVNSDPRRSNYYNLELSEIQVQGVRLQLDSSIFNGKFGTVLASDNIRISS